MIKKTSNETKKLKLLNNLIIKSEFVPSIVKTTHMCAIKTLNASKMQVILRNNKKLKSHKIILSLIGSREPPKNVHKITDKPIIQNDNAIVLNENE